MTSIHIEKYVDGICEEHLRVPVGPVKVMAKLLPGSVYRELRRKGIDLLALLDEPGSAPVQWLDVREGDVAKRIRITRGD